MSERCATALLLLLDRAPTGRPTLAQANRPGFSEPLRVGPSALKGAKYRSPTRGDGPVVCITPFRACTQQRVDFPTQAVGLGFARTPLWGCTHAHRQCPAKDLGKDRLLGED
jgi:hypothetical protein